MIAGVSTTAAMTMATIGAAISGRAKGKEYNMGLFNQRKDTVEWIEYRPDLLFYKWKDREIKKGSHLIIRAWQKAIFYSGGRIHGIFENEGNYDIDTQIIPFLTNISAALHLRSDTGERAEVYFVNSKDLTLNWGTTQRIMIPTPEVPSGIPVGMNGNMVIYFRDYLAFISKVAGVRDSYSINDVSERIRGEMSGIVAEAILNGERAVGLNVLVGLQANNRALGKKMAEELDKELFDIGLGVRDVNIISVSYPPEVQKMAEKVAAQSFITDTGKYVTVAAADGMEKGDSVAGLGAQHTLIAPKKGIDDGGVGLCAAHQKVNFGIRALAGMADLLFGGFAEGIEAIALGLLQVSLYQGFENGGVGTFHIIRGKLQLGLSIRHMRSLLCEMIPAVYCTMKRSWPQGGAAGRQTYVLLYTG